MNQYHRADTRRSHGQTKRFQCCFFLFVCLFFLNWHISKEELFGSVSINSTAITLRNTRPFVNWCLSLCVTCLGCRSIPFLNLSVSFSFCDVRCYVPNSLHSWKRNLLPSLFSYPFFANISLTKPLLIATFYKCHIDSILYLHLQNLFYFKEWYRKELYFESLSIDRLASQTLPAFIFK